MKLDIHSDERGELAEFHRGSGQTYVSRTRPGYTRANHYHLHKTEKFLVVEGEAILRLRLRGSLLGTARHLHGTDFEVIEVFPDIVHSITNVGKTDLVLVVWASEIFDPNDPDTYEEEA